jgi:hypothetical protein
MCDIYIYIYRCTVVQPMIDQTNVITCMVSVNHPLGGSFSIIPSNGIPGNKLLDTYWDLLGMVIIGFTSLILDIG